MAKKVGRPKKISASNHSLNDQGAKAHILNVGLDLFSKEGFAGTTINDIVAKADVNMSMVSYHFGGKEGLYIACVSHAAQIGLQNVERILTTVHTQEEFQIRIKIFVEDFFRFFVEQEPAAYLLEREFDHPTALTKQFIEKTHHHIIEVLNSFFKNAQKNKILKTNYNSNNITLLFLSSLISISSHKNLVRQTTNKSLSDPHFRNQMVSLILECLTPFLNE
jgi:AcrR family transcriptional regulator